MCIRVYMHVHVDTCEDTRINTDRITAVGVVGVDVEVEQPLHLGLVALRRCLTRRGWWSRPAERVMEVSMLVIGLFVEVLHEFGHRVRLIGEPLF